VGHVGNVPARIIVAAAQGEIGEVLVTGYLGTERAIFHPVHSGDPPVRFHRLEQALHQQHLLGAARRHGLQHLGRRAGGEAVVLGTLGQFHLVLHELEDRLFLLHLVRGTGGDCPGLVDHRDRVDPGLLFEDGEVSGHPAPAGGGNPPSAPLRARWCSVPRGPPRRPGLRRRRAETAGAGDGREDGSCPRHGPRASRSPSLPPST